MYILSVSVHTEKVSEKPNRPTRSNVSFYVLGHLSCPSCHAVVEVKTPKLGLVAYSKDEGVFTKPQHYISSAMVALCQRRDCQNCGVVSTVPKSDRDLYTERLDVMVTDDWIISQLYPEKRCQAF